MCAIVKKSKKIGRFSNLMQQFSCKKSSYLIQWVYFNDIFSNFGFNLINEIDLVIGLY